MKKNIDVLWDDNPINVSGESNFIWSIAGKLRGSYMPDKYGDVIIPMTILRRLECALEETKNSVITEYEDNINTPEKSLKKKAGYQFYNTSRFSLKELCNDPDNISENFKAYLLGFSANVQDIMKELELVNHINKMLKDGCLYTVVKAFSELDLNPKLIDSIKMGYIFENLIGRFYQNVDAGQFYTGRDIIKLLVSILISEGSDDIFDDHKVVTICDQACGTGGMLSTAYSYLKHYNPTIDVRLFGQEFMGQSYAIGLAEMLIKGQNSENFRHADTFKEDCFKDKKMRYVIENPPFGTPWSGKDAKEGQSKAVMEEYQKGETGRWGAGLPSGGDSQLIFLQSAIDKLDPKIGRAAIIENVSPLFNGSTSSGESQIRKWLLENDLIEAIIALPTDLFYNTSIQTYAWIISMNKREDRKGKIQLVDASAICHKLKKAVGFKKNEISPVDRKTITNLYTDFTNNEYCKIYNNEEFIYKEYVVMQPLQRSYGITKSRIENMLLSGTLSQLYDESKVIELENSTEKLSSKDSQKLEKYYANKVIFDSIIDILYNNISETKYLSVEDFMPILKEMLVNIDKKLIDKIANGLSEMDKTAVVQKDKKGNIIYDKDTKDVELVKFEENIDDYMRREVLPHIPDAKAFFEEDINSKAFKSKVGAEIPFPRYFYKYENLKPSKVLIEQLLELDKQADLKVTNLVK